MPKPATFAEAFAGVRHMLCKTIKTEGGLMAILQDKGVITEIERTALEIEKTDYHRCGKLLDLLVKCDDSNLEKFVDALRQTNQHHIVDCIYRVSMGVPDEVPTRKRIGLVPGECAPTFGNEYDKRRRREEPDGRYRGTTSCYIAALGIVLAAGVAVRVGYVQLSTTGKPITHTTPSQQESQPGEQSKEQNWFKAAFKNCRAKLVDSIDVEHNLLTLMRDKEVLTPRQIEDIKSKQTSSEKVERMLDLLEKRDNVRFKRFCEALIEDDQEHIIDKCLRKYCP